MPFLSDFLGKRVVDVTGEPVGYVKDMLADARRQAAHPPVVALIVRAARQMQLPVPLSQAADLQGQAIRLRVRSADISPVKSQDLLWLARDVLDREIIDTDDARVVRVNALELVEAQGRLYIANVGIGGLALLRRFGLLQAVQRLAGVFGKTLHPDRISWQHVELLTGGEHVRLRVASKRISDLPAADLAEIISDLGSAASSRVVESLDVEQLADALEEVGPDRQANLLAAMSDDMAADILEEMAPDEAADLLAELPEERSEDLLDLMEEDEADDVRRLLAYPQNTAGSLMTTDVATVPPRLTAEQAIEHLRANAREAESLYYVYVTDEQGRLAGVCSLQALVLADPQTPIREIMHDRVITVKPLDSHDEVGQTVAKYGLLSVPVVDDDNRLLGIVAADDAIDAFIPAAWKKRLPRFDR